MGKTRIVIVGDDPRVLQTVGSEIAALLDSLQVGWSWEGTRPTSSRHEEMVERIAGKLEVDLVTAVVDRG